MATSARSSRSSAGASTGIPPSRRARSASASRPSSRCSARTCACSGAPRVTSSRSRTSARIAARASAREARSSCQRPHADGDGRRGRPGARGPSVVRAGSTSRDGPDGSLPSAPLRAGGGVPRLRRRGDGHRGRPPRRRRRGREVPALDARTRDRGTRSRALRATRRVHSRAARGRCAGRRHRPHAAHRARGARAAAAARRAVVRRGARVAARAVRACWTASPSAWRRPTSRSRSRPGRSGSPSSIRVATGSSASRTTPACPPSRSATGRADYACARASSFSGEQHFYGLGQGGGDLDRLGVTRQLWNTHIGHGPGSDMGVPLLVSSRGYALFFDNPGRRVDRRRAIGRRASASSTPRRRARSTWYFLHRRRPARGDARGGRAARPRAAAAALGARLSPVDATLPRHGGAPAAAAHHPREAHSLRRADLPLDATARRAAGTAASGHLEFQPELWPDPAALLGEARSQHFEVITHEYPVLHEESPLFAEAESRGYLLAEGYERAGTTGASYRQGQRYIDFSNPAAGAWWWAAHRELRPARRRGMVARRRRGPAGDVDASRRRRADCSTTSTIGSVTQAFAEGEATDRPDQRVFLLCRSGAAGMQRFGSTCWSGDINNDFRDARGADPARAQHGTLRRPVLGHRRRRLLPSDPGDRRALRALVPARRLQPDLPVARLGVARARAVGARRARSRRSAGSTRSCAIGCCPTRTRSPGRRTRWGCR